MSENKPNADVSIENLQLELAKAQERIRVLEETFVTEAEDRKLAEDEFAVIMQSERFLRRSAELTHVGYAIWDDILDRDVTVSEELALIHGLSREDYLERVNSMGSYLEFVVPEDREKYQAYEDDFAEDDSGSEAGVEYRIMRTDGEVRHLYQRSQYVPVASGKPTQSIVVIQDITELKQFELQLQESQAALEENEAMLNQSAAMANIGHAIWDRSSETYESVSDGWASIFGYTADEFLAEFSTVEDDARLIHPEDRELYRRYYTSSDDEVVIEYRICRKDGDIRHIRQDYQVISQDTPDSDRALVTIIDITEQVLREIELDDARQADADRAATLEQLNRALLETQDQVRNAQQQAEQANQAKSQFLATMSHEIRSPLHVLLTMNSLLAESDLTAEQREYVNLASDGGQNLMSLINDILDLSKIETGKLELQYDWFNPHQTIEQIVEYHYGRAEEKGIELIGVTSPVAAEMCHGDENRVRQILINLVTNAIKFTHTGGVIVRLLPSDQGIEIQVEDSGIGIAEDRQDQIFDEFNQGEQGTTRKYGGTGLGLSIVRRLVGLMDGHVALESVEGEGSLFRVVLPMEREGSAYLELLNAENDIYLDLENPVLAQGIYEQVELLGGHASIVGDDGVKAAREGREVVYLVDGANPLQSASEARRRLSARLSGLSAKLGVLVGLSKSSALTDGLEAGFETVLRKPFRASDIQSQLLAREQDDSQAKQSQQISPETLELGAGKVILLVEDSVSIQAVTEALLVRRQFEVVIADNGLQAVEQAADRQFDLILMDVAMPVMDGLTATREIRGRPGLNQKSPIIAITSNAFAEDRERCLSAGMDDFISKPLNIESFFEKLAHWLGAGESASKSRVASVIESKIDEAMYLSIDVLETLADSVSWEVLPSITDTYLEESAKRVKLCKDLLATGDLAALGEHAHALKSSSGSLGLLNFQALAAQLERAAKQSEESGVVQLMGRLEEVAHFSSAALQAYMEEQTSKR